MIENTSSAPRPVQVVTVSLDETLKQMRAELKREFPTTKFSVRRARGTAYGYVDVSYTNGPDSRSVEGVCKAYEGQGFDGMTDSTYTITHTSADAAGNPIIVRHCTRGILVHRTITQDIRAGVIRIIVRRFAEYDELRAGLLALSDSELVGRASQIRADNHEWLDQMSYRALRDSTGWFGESIRAEIAELFAASEV